MRRIAIAAILTLTVFLVLSSSPGTAGTNRFTWGTLTAINALFEPNGYEEEGRWTGQGSGAMFSTGACRNRVCMKTDTQVGIISLPYVDAGMRWSGTNLNYDPNEPLTFDMADGAAQMSIQSEWHPNAGVRWSGTNITMETAAGPIAIYAEPESLEIEAGELTWLFTTADGSWTLVCDGQ